MGRAWLLVLCCLARPPCPVAQLQPLLPRRPNPQVGLSVGRAAWGGPCQPQPQPRNCFVTGPPLSQVPLVGSVATFPPLRPSPAFPQGIPWTVGPMPQPLASPCALGRGPGGPCTASGSVLCPQSYFCHVGAGPGTTLCCPLSQTDICRLPPAVGRGSARLPRLYFDSATASCRPFVYAGLQGNANNFPSLQACLATCLASAAQTPYPASTGLPTPPSAASPCQPGEQPLLTPFNTPQPCNLTLGCGAGFWCHFGASADTTVCCPESSSDACSFRLSLGTGDFQLPRFYFNSVVSRCDAFTYTGVQGNQNNFLSRAACEETCVGPAGVVGDTSTAIVPVNTPASVAPGSFSSPCLGNQYSDRGRGPIRCSAESGSGCPLSGWCHVGSTAETTLCCEGGLQRCAASLMPGSGPDALDRFYFNADRQACLPFLYTGLYGSANNFLSLQDCQDACLPANATDGFPPDQGHVPTATPAGFAQQLLSRGLGPSTVPAAPASPPTFAFKLPLPNVPLLSQLPPPPPALTTNYHYEYLDLEYNYEDG